MIIAVIFVFGFCLTPVFGSHQSEPKVPVIDVTDLYQPFQDPGDNFDLIAGYGLGEVDLKAVILDTHDSFRKPISDHPLLHDSDKNGPRDPGFVSVLQLNYIFNRNVPAAASPFTMMKSPEDRMLEIPAFQQQGVELILKVLRESPEPVSIVSFGSARSIAVAYNRDPQLFHRKLKRIYLSAGSSTPGYLEWNVALDPNAFVRLVRSDLPIDIFPCATKDGPFSYDSHNSYWKLPNLNFIRSMAPQLRRYLDVALARSCRCDFLRAMDQDEFSAADEDSLYAHGHNVWETAVWMAVTGRVLAKHEDGTFAIVSASHVMRSDRVLLNRLDPITPRVDNLGTFTYTPATKSNFRLYERGDPGLNERALRQALPALYLSFQP